MNKQRPFPPVDRTTLREQCLRLIRSRVADGSLPPGYRLVETDLAEQLGVSRGTLREALRHLQEEGLVEADDRGHLRVRVLTPEEIREVYDVRTALESWAACVIASRTDRSALVQRLREAAHRIDRFTSDFPRHVEADIDFHRLLVELAGNRVLLEAWSRLGGLIRVTMVAADEPTLLPLMSASRHEQIVDAIGSGSVDETRRAVLEHMMEAADRLVDALAAEQAS
jgi:DNA-binding GntR family transcriptional regulator